MESEPLLTIRHGIAGHKYPMMLLPLGYRFNTDILEAEIGSKAIIQSTGEEVKILRKAVIPLKSSPKSDYSELSNTLSIGIYGKTINVIFDLMTANWKYYIKDKNLLLLVVEKIDNGEKTTE
jgi:hypothetical protein